VFADAADTEAVVAAAPASPVDSEVGDVAAAFDETGLALLEEAAQSDSVKEANSPLKTGNFDFWKALKEFFAGIINHFEGDGSRQYEEYVDN
jgi:hypothetical protein